MFNKTIILENPYEPLEVLVTRAFTSPSLDNFLEYPENLNYISLYIPVHSSDIKLGLIKNLQYSGVSFGNFTIVGLYIQANRDNGYLYQKIELTRMSELIKVNND